MTGGFREWRGAWLERGRKAGFLLLLLGLCAGLGLLIALPLWLFATSEPRIYTIVGLAVLAGGVLFLCVRAWIRRRRLPPDPARPRRSVLAGLLSTLSTLLGLAGAYATAALLVRGLWILALITVLLVGLLVWLLVRLRAAARKAHKLALAPAENRSR